MLASGSVAAAAGACRPSKQEVGEYVDLIDHAAVLHAKMQDTCMQSPQFAERLVTGAVVMADSSTSQDGPCVAVVLGLEADIKVPSHHSTTLRPLLLV